MINLENSFTRYEIPYIGYHACKLEVGNLLVNEQSPVLISENEYDWLGHGFYIWENSLFRAIEFANEKKKWLGSDSDWVVVGVIYQLSNCLDTTTIEGTRQIELGN